MRSVLRTAGSDMAIWLAVLIVGAGAWIARRPTSYILLVIVALFPTVIATLRHVQVLRLKRAAEQAATAAAETERAAAVDRGRSLDAARTTVTGGINATIVEIVAAQQALVRAAHPDDILLRLTAADDAAHAVLADASKIG